MYNIEMQAQEKNPQKFSPIFIVGAPRSGTTMLAVLMNRHSSIAIPPETQFFTEFLVSENINEELSSRKELVKKALNFGRIADMHLSEKEVLERFKRLDYNSANLLRSLLEVYSAKHGKRRVGEKSPKHIEHVPKILAAYPHAKIICIVRDGRDVVRSTLKVPWAEPTSTRRLRHFCVEWREYVSLLLSYQERFTRDSLHVVKYEELLQASEKKLKTICNFLGEEFEPQQLVEDRTSLVVPEWEGGWKGKASKSLDPSRAYAWKEKAELSQVLIMNSMMGGGLRSMGYHNTDLKGVIWAKRVWLFLQKIPYCKPLRPLSKHGLKILRLFKVG